MMAPCCLPEGPRASAPSPSAVATRAAHMAVQRHANDRCCRFKARVSGKGVRGEQCAERARDSRRWTIGIDKSGGTSMTAKKTPKEAKPSTVPNDPEAWKGRLKRYGGSQCDHWNATLANQTGETLWLKNSDAETSGQQQEATIAALLGIGPSDELEGMMAAQ